MKTKLCHAVMIALGLALWAPAQVNKLRPPHGPRIARIERAGRTISATETGVWQVRLEPHQEYTIVFE